MSVHHWVQKKNNEYTSDRHKGRRSGEFEQLNSGRGETGDKIMIEFYPNMCMKCNNGVHCFANKMVIKNQTNKTEV